MNYLQFYLEKIREKGIRWETDLFNIIALGRIKSYSSDTPKTQSDFPLIPINNSLLKTKSTFGHVINPKNIDILIKLQNRKNNPISAFKNFIKDDFIKHGIANLGNPSCVFIIEGNIVYSFKKDALSFTEKGGARRFIKLNKMENIKNKKFISKIRKEFWDFYSLMFKNISKTKAFIEMKKQTRVSLNFSKYSRELIEGLAKIFYTDKKKTDKLKQLIISKIMKFWKNSYDKYKKEYRQAYLYYFKNISNEKESLKTHDEILVNNFSIIKCFIMKEFLTREIENTLRENSIPYKVFSDFNKYKKEIRANLNI